MIFCYSIVYLLRIREAKQEIMNNNNFPIEYISNIQEKEHSIIDMYIYEAEEAKEAEEAEEETEQWNIKMKVIELLLFLTFKS